MKKISLSHLIFQQYVRSALFVILTVELLLLLMYFGITSYFEGQVKRELVKEVQLVADSVANGVAGPIVGNFQAIEEQASAFAEAHAQLMSDPETIAFEAGEPRFGVAPNGSVYQSNLTNGSSFFVPAPSVARMGEAQWRFATNSAVLNPLYKFIVDGNPLITAAYINLDEPCDMNRLYPFIKSVWEQYPNELDMKEYNFWYEADKENNPGRTAKWTTVYLDPAGNSWMFSCVAPVYIGDNLKAVVGLDVTIKDVESKFRELNKNLISNSKISREWGTRIALVHAGGGARDSSEDQESLLIADDETMRLLKLKSPEKPKARPDTGTYEKPVDPATHRNTIAPEELLIKSINDPVLRGQLIRATGLNGEMLELQIGGAPYFLCPSRIGESGWSCLVFFRKDSVFRAIDEMTGNAKKIGLWIFLGIALFYAAFFMWLRNRARRLGDEIAAPLEQLSRLTANIDLGGSTSKFVPTGIEEVDSLSDNFAKMSASLGKKTSELIASQLMDKEAELDFARGLYQSASANLHDVGNAVTVLESSLIDLRKILRSTDQYAEVFSRLKHGGSAGGDLLGRFEKVLIGETVPRLRSLRSSIVRLKDAIKRSILEQQAAFRTAKLQSDFKLNFSQASEQIDLSVLLEEMCAIFRRDYLPLQTDIAPGLTVRSHRTHLWAGLDNVIRNAIEASPRHGLIRVAAAATEGGVVVRVADEGDGVRPEILGKVGERGFTTKREGHGLGLSSFREFLEFFGGTLKIHSAGEKQGTTVTMEIRNA